MRFRRTAGREIGHVQIKADRISQRKPFEFAKKQDFIALAATGVTLPEPEAVLAFEHRKRRMPVVVTGKRAAGGRNLQLKVYLVAPDLQPIMLQIIA